MALDAVLPSYVRLYFLDFPRYIKQLSPPQYGHNSRFLNFKNVCISPSCLLNGLAMKGILGSEILGVPGLLALAFLPSRSVGAEASASPCGGFLRVFYV